ncbi:PilZ domain-containing protein [Robertmurraya kyonggiensis]|uniref:PilZ domain-containing protein n=1 Tax=Robertmurraya kyonggiensis TaxID=1037680 RepID=A0A4U1D786_9BACI|nr:PilZ domain-containing protein [Robertmurraya kyonggiensis]TKC18469.1 PilZ domain-containing protein [Robertmurraya kyonggiensis]
MPYRRDEPFRFTFGTPIEGTFKILRINKRASTSKEGTASIVDLSPNGVRFLSPLDLPINEKDLLMEVNFLLNEKNISIIAKPKWKKRISPYTFSYGLEGLDDDETKKVIVEELKEFARNQK